MYDFIKSLCIKAGKVSYKVEEAPQMKVFFDLWNDYSSETFHILDHLVNDTENAKEEHLKPMTCFGGDDMAAVPIEEEY